MGTAIPQHLAFYLSAYVRTKFLKTQVRDIWALGLTLLANDTCYIRGDGQLIIRMTDINDSGDEQSIIEGTNIVIKGGTDSFARFAYRGLMNGQ